MNLLDFVGRFSCIHWVGLKENYCKRTPGSVLLFPASFSWVIWVRSLSMSRVSDCHVIRNHSDKHCAPLTTINGLFFSHWWVDRGLSPLAPATFPRKAIEFDARLMSLMVHGVQAVWPHKAQMGGYPGRAGQMGHGITELLELMLVNTYQQKDRMMTMSYTQFLNSAMPRFVWSRWVGTVRISSKQLAPDGVKVGPWDELKLSCSICPWKNH